MEKAKLMKGFSNLQNEKEREEKKVQHADLQNTEQTKNQEIQGINVTQDTEEIKPEVVVETQPAVEAEKNKPIEVENEKVEVGKKVGTEEKTYQPETSGKPYKERVSVVAPREELPLSEVAVITKNTVIKGIVTTKGHAKVEGAIEGSIKCEGNLNVTGKITGDVLGGNIELQGCNVQGNLAAKGGIIIGKGIPLNGDIVSEKLILDGAVKGNIKVSKDAHFSESAVVEGSVEANKLTMIAGAKLQGHVSIK